ncbi:MAG: uridine kinase [Verrucomicrobiota bacterium]|nr:uridine kinase [Verrucomicrobiota bacterium]
MSYFVLIGGGTCSGKTTLTANIVEKLPYDFTWIKMDDYYHDLTHFSPKQMKLYNFDTPESIDFDALEEDVTDLLNGKTIQKRSYNFVKHAVTISNEVITPREIIIVEGIFAFCEKTLFKKADLKIYADLDSDLRLARRLIRDVAERGFDFKGTINQYLKNVRPMHEKYIERSKEYADIIMHTENNFDKLLKEIDTLLKKMKAE